MANYTIAVLQTLQEGFSFVSFQFPPEGGNGASNRLQVTGGDTITFDPGNIQSGSISIGAVEGFTNNNTIILTSGGANVVRTVSSVFNGPAEIDAQSDGFADILYLNVANATDVTTVDITDRILGTTEIDVQEGTSSTIPVTVTISNPSQSTYYWTLNPSGSTDFTTTSGTPTLDGSNQFAVNLAITNDTTDETGLQGETYTFEVYDTQGGTLLGSESFILYDNDLQVTVTESTITVVDPDALTFPITINNNGVAGGQDARIFITTSGFQSSIAFPTIPAAGSSSTVNIPTSWVPDGQTRDFRLDVKYASFGYVLGADTFTVTRALVNVTTPTSISYNTAGTESANTTVTVTASGGGDGTLEVSVNNADWFANGSSFNVTRGSTYTFYARSNYNSGEIVSSVLTDTDGYTAPYIDPSIATHTPAGPIGANQDGYTFGLTNATATTNAYRVSYDTVTTVAELVSGGGTLVGWFPYATAATKTLTNAQLPTVGNSTGYRIWSFRYSTSGGSGAYDLADTSLFTISRSSYTTPETSITASTNSPIAFGATTHNVTISNNADGVTVYELRSGSYSGTILATITGNGTATGLAGGVGTYYITAYVPTANGGQGTAGRVNVTSYTISVQNQPDVISSFAPALSSYVENSGTQTVTFSFSVSDPSVSTYYWRLVRVNGTDEPDFATTEGSVLVSSPSFSTTISSNVIDETGSQGETFYAQLFSDSGRTQQVGSNSSQFTLFDNDVAFAIGTISPSSTISSSYGYPDPVSVQVTNNGQSGLQPSSRIYNVTKAAVAYEIVDLPSTGNTETYTLNLSNDNALPDIGTTNTYRLDVYNGSTLLAGPTFNITRQFVLPETSITVSTNSPIAFGATSHNVTISNNADGITVYRIRSSSYSGTVLGTITGNGTATGLTGGAGTYYITAHVPTANGGQDTSGEVNVTTYSVTQSAADNEPDGSPFTFAAKTGQALNATNVTSTSTWTITGIDTNVDISISGTGAQYQINGGTWTNASQTAAVSVNDVIGIRGTAPSTYSTVNNITLTVGSGTGTYQISTIAEPSSGPSEFGLEIYNSSGNLIVGTTSDLIALAAYDQITIPASGSVNITVPGMRNTNQWQVVIYGTESSIVLNVNITWSKSTDTLTLNNTNSSSASTINYLVFRQG